MNPKIPPRIKILLPIDGSEHSRRAVQFSGYLGTALSKTLTDITLLRVVTGRYMKSHIPFFDFRSDILKQSDAFKNFKQRHIKENIMPSLEEGESILKEEGLDTAVEKLVVEGEPAHEIVRIANKGNFSIIIMARRGLSELSGIILGSVTNKVVHSAVGQTVYIVGQKFLPDKRCPVPKILIPVDGSPYSLKGVKHAALLAHILQNYINNITLLRVINLAFYETRLLEGIDLEEEARKIIDEAKDTLLKRGVPEGIITTKIRVGIPAEEILREADEEEYNLIIMGRKGRTAFRDFILGGVSSTVMQRCQNQTIAVVSSG